MWKQKKKKPNSVDLVPDLLEEVFLGLPVDSIQRFKTVSKEWRSILESKVFLERRMNLGNSRRKILAAHNCDCGRRPIFLPESRFEGEEEIVYLHCDFESPTMTCDGLVCFYEFKWFNVFNPSTTQLRRFYFGLDPCHSGMYEGAGKLPRGLGSWTMGFGRDSVTGSYKVVRICFGNRFGVMQCAILDVETGEWRELSPPSHYMSNLGSKSVCVNGSIYWLQIHMRGKSHKLLALDLHKEEFHNVVSVPASWLTLETQLANLEDRLALAKTIQVGPELIVEILRMDADEGRWTKTYSVSLARSGGIVSPERRDIWFTPVAVSNQGNLVFYDNHKRMLKYYIGTDEICCLSTDTCVLSLYLENLVLLPLNSNHDPHPDPDPHDPFDSDFFRKRKDKCHLRLGPASWIPKVRPPSASTVRCILLFILQRRFCEQELHNHNKQMQRAKLSCKGVLLSALKDFACLFAEALNDDKNDCASTMFDYSVRKPEY